MRLLFTLPGMILTAAVITLVVIIAKIVYLRVLFLWLAFSMFAQICKADGTVSRKEIDFLEMLMKEDLKFSRLERWFSISAFRNSLRGRLSFISYADEFFRQFHKEPGLLFHMVTLLVRLSVADGRLSFDELTQVRAAAYRFGMSPQDFNRLLREMEAAFETESRSESESRRERARQRAKEQRTRPEEAKAPRKQAWHEVLGCKPDASEDEIKQAYRSLAKQYHPDALRSKGLPQALIDQATAKFIKIKAAYDQARALGRV